MGSIARFFIYSKVAFFLVITCTSCYRMPTDDDFSVVPTTNNPAVTCEKPASLLPAGLGR